MFKPTTNQSVNYRLNHDRKKKVQQAYLIPKIDNFYLKEIMAIILENTLFLPEPCLALLEPELVRDADPALFLFLTTAGPYRDDEIKLSWM